MRVLSIEGLKYENDVLAQECSARLDALIKACRERDRYKQALERIVKSTSGTFRDIAREALHPENT